MAECPSLTRYPKVRPPLCGTSLASTVKPSALNTPGARLPKYQSPRSPAGVIGKCGGDIPRASTSSAPALPSSFWASCSGSRSVTRASSRSPAEKNGNP